MRETSLGLFRVLTIVEVDGVEEEVESGTAGAQETPPPPVIILEYWN